MKLDFLICGSPNDAFFSQIAFFSLCLRALPEAYRNARLVAVFGDDTIKTIPEEWIPYFETVETHWVISTDQYFTAQHDRRFELMRDDADLVIMCDADVALMNPFDELIKSLMSQASLAGVIAHYHFPWSGRERNPEVDWDELSQAVLGRNIARDYRYTFLARDAPPSAPFYINYGVLMGPCNLLKDLYQRDKSIRLKTAEMLGSWWSFQASIALSCADSELNTRALPMKYNFPNDPIADGLYSEQMQEIVFLHYLRTEVFDRQKIFASEGEFTRFIQLKLEGSNRKFQEFVIKLTNSAYPFQRMMTIT